MEDAQIQKGRADAKDVQHRTQRIGQNGHAVCGAHGTKGYEVRIVPFNMQMSAPSFRER